jgi:hypothetical protein
MKSIIFFALCLCTGCNPAEISMIEAVTEEAIIIERDIFESHEKVSVPTDELNECRGENAVQI